MITLRKMDGEEFTAFLARSIPEYASEKVKAGNWTLEEAAERSRQEHASLLPQGLGTPNHHLYTIELDGVPTGNIWLAVDERGNQRRGFIYDVYVVEAYRRRGVAMAAMLSLEEEAAKLSLHSLGLHVFGYNTAALALYEKLGYEVTNINMAKILEGKEV